VTSDDARRLFVDRAERNGLTYVAVAELAGMTYSDGATSRGPRRIPRGRMLGGGLKMIDSLLATTTAPAFAFDGSAFAWGLLGFGLKVAFAGIALAAVLAGAGACCVFGAIDE
jgi:hypothetical protein